MGGSHWVSHNWLRKLGQLPWCRACTCPAGQFKLMHKLTQKSETRYTFDFLRFYKRLTKMNFDLDFLTDYVNLDYNDLKMSNLDNL